MGIVTLCRTALGESKAASEFRCGKAMSQADTLAGIGAELGSGWSLPTWPFVFTCHCFAKWSVVAISFASVRRVREGAAAAKRLGSLGDKEWRQG